MSVAKAHGWYPGAVTRTLVLILGDHGTVLYLHLSKQAL
jgi:hypothetical protein